jgi:hypothetical protein
MSVILPYTSQSFLPIFSDQSSNPNILPPNNAIPVGVMAQFWGVGFWIALVGGVVTVVGFGFSRPQVAASSTEIPAGSCIIDPELTVVKESPECDDEEILKEQMDLLEEEAEDSPDVE